MKKTNPLIICLAIVFLLSACGPRATPRPPATEVSIATDTPVAPAASPTGQGRIAFDSDRHYPNPVDCSPHCNLELYVMNVDGSGVTRLTNNPAEDGWASWSPDGTRLAFASGRAGMHEIYVMNADGTAQTNLTNNPADDVIPSWSPDGSRIAFQSFRDLNREIYVMNADGTGQANLTNNPADDHNPFWSPDATRIAFHSDRDDPNPGDCYPHCNLELYVMNVDGSGVTRLTNNPAGDGYASWSPDGRHIAFSSNRDVNWEIYVMNADGTRQTNLTNNPANDGWPSWSPDGTRLAFASNRDGHWDIYVMNADGSGMICLTNGPANGGRPSWSQR